MHELTRIAGVNALSPEAFDDKLVDNGAMSSLGVIDAFLDDNGSL